MGPICFCAIFCHFTIQKIVLRQFTEHEPPFQSFFSIHSLIFSQRPCECLLSVLVKKFVQPMVCIIILVGPMNRTKCFNPTRETIKIYCIWETKRKRQEKKRNKLPKTKGLNKTFQLRQTKQREARGKLESPSNPSCFNVFFSFLQFPLRSHRKLRMKMC
jgi:hypothetical protein